MCICVYVVCICVCMCVCMCVCVCVCVCVCGACMRLCVYKFSRMGSQCGKVYSGLLYIVLLWITIVAVSELHRCTHSKAIMIRRSKECFNLLDF